MTKRELLMHFPSQSAIAAFYGISDAAVAMWKIDEPIPELREIQLQQRRPDLYRMVPATRRKGRDR